MISQSPSSVAARRMIARASLMLLLSAVAGCPPPAGNTAQTTTPTIPRETKDIVAAVEANAVLLDRPLWAAALSATARLKDEKGRARNFNLEGTLLFQKPRNLRVDLRPAVGDRVMGLGSNNESYWLWVEPEIGTMRWGRHQFAGQPCCKSTFRPDQVVAAMGLTGLPGPADGLMGPERKYGRRYDILTYSRRAPGGYLIDREYWIDRSPPYLIRLVLFRDATGQVAMSAFLDGYKPAWEGGPLVPHAISMIWPHENDKLSLAMTAVTGLAADKVKPTAFAMPTPADLPRGVKNIIQVDKDCGG